MTYTPLKSFPQPSASDFREVRGRTLALAYLMGLTIVASSVILGRSYAFFIAVPVFSFFITFLWRKTPRPWIILVMILTATPLPLFRYQIAANLFFAFFLLVLNLRFFFNLPKWIYLPIALAAVGFVLSSFNWMSADVIGSVLRQGAFAFNFLLAPLILLPLTYFRMEKSRDTDANLRTLIFCLIVPTTLLLLAARVLGHQTNVWEASIDVDRMEGYAIYQIGKVTVSFGRTGVGFILAALICASTAITFSRVKTLFRIVAATTLAINTFFLISVGSFGSGLACFCGLAGIFYAQIRSINIMRVFVSVFAIVCMLFLIFAFSPPNIKRYLEKRYEYKVTTGMNQDRFLLWSLGWNYFLQNPLGVGLTLTVGDRRTNPHNDYLMYFMSYGFIGGMAYLLLVAGLLIHFLRGRTRNPGDHSALAVNLAGLGVICALAANSFTDHIGVNRWYFNVIWSLVWYCYFCNRSILMTSLPETQMDLEIEAIPGKPFPVLTNHG